MVGAGKGFTDASCATGTVITPVAIGFRATAGADRHVSVPRINSKSQNLNSFGVLPNQLCVPTAAQLVVTGPALDAESAVCASSLFASALILFNSRHV